MSLSRSNSPYAFQRSTNPHGQLLAFSLDGRYELRKANIAYFPCDAIVSVCDRSRGAAGIISEDFCEVAGPSLQVYLTDNFYEDFEAGNAVVTPAFNITSSRHIILTTAPDYYTPSETPWEVALTQCYTNCLKAAVQVGAKSVAFPCIGTEISRNGFAIPAGPAAAIALRTVTAFFEHHPYAEKHRRAIDKVVFILWNDHELENQHAYMAQWGNFFALTTSFNYRMLGPGYNQEVPISPSSSASSPTSALSPRGPLPPIRVLSDIILDEYGHNIETPAEQLCPYTRHPVVPFTPICSKSSSSVLCIDNGTEKLWEGCYRRGGLRRKWDSFQSDDLALFGSRVGTDSPPSTKKRRLDKAETYFDDFKKSFPPLDTESLICFRVEGVPSELPNSSQDVARRDDSQVLGDGRYSLSEESEEDCSSREDSSIPSTERHSSLTPNQVRQDEESYKVAAASPPAVGSHTPEFGSPVEEYDGSRRYSEGLGSDFEPSNIDPSLLDCDTPIPSIEEDLNPILDCDVPYPSIERDPDTVTPEIASANTTQFGGILSLGSSQFDTLRELESPTVEFLTPLSQLGENRPPSNTDEVLDNQLHHRESKSSLSDYVTPPRYPSPEVPAHPSSPFILSLDLYEAGFRQHEDGELSFTSSFSYTTPIRRSGNPSPETDLETSTFDTATDTESSYFPSPSPGWTSSGWRSPPSPSVIRTSSLQPQFLYHRSPSERPPTPTISEISDEYFDVPLTPSPPPRVREPKVKPEDTDAAEETINLPDSEDEAAGRERGNSRGTGKGGRRSARGGRRSGPNGKAQKVEKNAGAKKKRTVGKRELEALIETTLKNVVPARPKRERRPPERYTPN